MAVTRTIHVSRNGPEVPLWKIATSQLTWLCSRPIRKESRLLAADRDREVGISSRNQALTRCAFGATPGWATGREYIHFHSPWL